METEYRKILKEELARRKKLNASYSLRSFARQICISPSRLSEILSHNERLSLQSANKVVEHLKLSAAQREAFCYSVELEQSQQNSELAKTLKHRINSLTRTKILTDDQLEAIGNWWYHAILAYRQMETRTQDLAWMAQCLGIDLPRIHSAWRRLIRLGLLTEDGKPTSRDFSAGGDRVGQAIRTLHRQLIEKAAESIDQQEVADRELGALMIAFDSEKTSQAKARIRQFMMDFKAEFGARDHPDHVYALTLQFFRITKPEE